MVQDTNGEKIDLSSRLTANDRVIVASDCVGRLWHTREILLSLRELGKKAPIAILEVLPERLLDGTALGRGKRIEIGQAARACYERVKPVDPWELVVLYGEASSVNVWGTLIRDPQTQIWQRGWQFNADTKWADENFGRGNRLEGVNGKKRLARFFADTSPDGQTLAAFLSASILTLPMMRAIQQTFLPDADPNIPIAELFLSGMLRQVPELGLYEGKYPFYDFRPTLDDHPGFRASLMLDLGISEARDVLPFVANELLKEKERPVIRQIDTLLREDTSLETGQEPLRLDAPVSACYARVVATTISRWGESYAPLRDLIEAALPKSAGPLGSTPAPTHG